MARYASVDTLKHVLDTVDERKDIYNDICDDYRYL